MIMIPVPDLSYSGLMTILALSLLLCLNLTWTTQLNCDDVWISNAVSMSLTRNAAPKIGIGILSGWASCFPRLFQQFSRSSNCKIPFAQSKHFSEADTISWSNMAYGYISGTSPYLVVSGWIRLWTCRCCSFSGNSSSPFLLLNSPTFYWWTSNFVLQKIIKPTILKSLNSTSVSLDFILAHYETIPNPLNHWTIRAIMGHP